MAQSFVYNAAHQVVVCRDCQTYVVPTAAGRENHLRAAPHCLRGEALKTTMELLSSYRLRTAAELKQGKPLTKS
jgi:hypothetical protein